MLFHVQKCEISRLLKKTDRIYISPSFFFPGTDFADRHRRGHSFVQLKAQFDLIAKNDVTDVAVV